MHDAEADAEMGEERRFIDPKDPKKGDGDASGLIKGVLPDQ